MDSPVLIFIGAICFGLVIGWVTYRTLHYRKETPVLADISTVIGAVGGGAVTALFKDTVIFAGYCIGLAVGFFAYFLVSLAISGKKSVSGWMGE